MKGLLRGFAHLLAPRVCRVCGCSLGVDEEYLCLECLLDLPRTGVHSSDFNIVHQRLGHHCKVARAAGWFYYKRESPYAQLLIDAKYGNLPRLAFRLGAICASELASDGFFDGIEGLVPMPMHWRKRLERGYNQAEEICLGISSATGLPVWPALKAARSHGIQARHSREARFKSIADTLAAARHELVAGRHALFVDDIITTGASAAEAVKTLQTASPASVSVLCLGLTALQ